MVFWVILCLDLHLCITVVLQGLRKCLEVKHLTGIDRKNPKSWYVDSINDLAPVRGICTGLYSENRKDCLFFDTVAFSFNSEGNTIAEGFEQKLE